VGKTKKRPSDYRPALEFMIREKREGGRVLAPAVVAGDEIARWRRRCLVLVHGFNNNDGEAAIAYHGFRTRQQEIFPEVTAPTLDGRLGDAFWPGDAAWRFFDFLDFGVYSAAVGHARLTARELAATLRERMPQLVEVDFVGHSLGCRVILETLDILRDSAPFRVRRVCLMAAAVPSEMLEPGGIYYELLQALSNDGTQVRVLRSMHDEVLHFAFPAGQAMAGPDERSTRALGRFGVTPLMPGYRATLDDQELSGANHGDYWGHSKTGISREATALAGEFLRIGRAARTVSRPRVFGAPASSTAARTIGEPREIE
jgi:pimeloyl-ACP methyl ester carboxylesterase